MPIIVLAPVIGWSWPALVPLMLTAAGLMGFKAVFDSEQGGELNEALRLRILNETSIRLQLDAAIEHAIFDEVRRGDCLILEKGPVLLMITKDDRGRLRVNAVGPNTMSRGELTKVANDYLSEVAQLFAQNRVVDELKRLNFDIVEEGVDEKQEIVLKVRRWT